ncbi:MAG: hypothetical protein LKI18_00485 [Prevotella sp.]|jgi:hypothetical protein|nr:hypothetical protein [Prevotella sp.]
MWSKHFTFAQASAVNDYMRKNHNRKQDAEDLSLLSRPFITEDGYNKSKPELKNVVNDFNTYERAERERLAEVEHQDEEERQARKRTTEGKRG